MKKYVSVVVIIMLFIFTFISGCTETNDSDSIEQNKLPVPVIKIINEYILWWNDTLRVTAEDSYDSDGNITSYVWWFDDGFGYTESKTGAYATFDLPYTNINCWPPKAKLTLSLTDDKGASAFAYNNSIVISSDPYISLEQIGSTDILEVDFVIRENLQALNKSLHEDELSVYRWFNGFTNGVSSYVLGFTDVDENGYISEGDTFNLSEIFVDRYGDISGSTVKIELRGDGYNHNDETTVASIEVTVE